MQAVEGGTDATRALGRGAISAFCVAHPSAARGADHNRTVMPADGGRVGGGAAALRMPKRADHVSAGYPGTAVLQRIRHHHLRMLWHGHGRQVCSAGRLGGHRRWRRNVLLGTGCQLAHLHDIRRLVDARRGHRADLASSDRNVRIGHVVRAVLVGGRRSSVYSAGHGRYRHTARREPSNAYGLNPRRH